MRAMSGCAGLMTGGTRTSVRAFATFTEPEDPDQVAQLLPRDVGAERSSTADARLR